MHSVLRHLSVQTTFCYVFRERVTVFTQSLGCGILYSVQPSNKLCIHLQEITRRQVNLVCLSAQASAAHRLPGFLCGFFLCLLLFWRERGCGKEERRKGNGERTEGNEWARERLAKITRYRKKICEQVFEGWFTSLTCCSKGEICEINIHQPIEMVRGQPSCWYSNPDLDLFFLLKSFGWT